MPKIITFTANLLAETTYVFEAWRPEKTQRAVDESFQVGGKGINVSKMLNRLGADNAAVCFPGGPFGPRCEVWLERAGIPIWPFREDCVARSGTVVRAGDRNETTFLGLDSVVSRAAVDAVVAALKGLDEPFVFAICGSVQGWEEDRWEPLRDWIRARGEAVTLAVDNYGPSLHWLAEQQPALVKFNRDELEQLFDDEERTQDTPSLLERASRRFPGPNWIVTDGGNPIWVKSGEASAEQVVPPPVELVSSTGCGDVFFATVLDCLYNKERYTLLEAARLAADYASRSAAMPGIAEFEL